MPKFGSHILFAQLASQKDPALVGNVTNAMRLGAIGPDMTLFLFDPYFHDPTVRAGFDIALKVLRLKREIEEELDRIRQIFAVQEDLLAWVTGNLSTDLIRLAESSLDVLLLSLKLSVAVNSSSIKLDNPIYPLILSGQLSPLAIATAAYRNPSLVVDATDTFGFPFRYFGHPYTDDPGWHKPAQVGDYSEWWWMDMLHYRKTGDFAKNLLKIGKANRGRAPIMLEYAKGYVSHVAGDICGHPFVNSLVHGPFRNHAYRHIVLEGLADTWLWDHVYGKDISESSFHKQIKLGESELDSIADQIIEAMKATYKAPDIPDMLSSRYPSRDELRGAYGFMYEYLGLSTGGKTSKPKAPPDSPKEILDELQDLLSKYSPTSPPTWNGSDPWASILAALGWIMRGITFLVMIATLPAALMSAFLAGPIRWLLYLIHLAIYAIVSGLRTLLALMGWGYASNDDFRNFGVLEDLITADVGSLQGHYPYAGDLRRPRPPFYWMMKPSSLGAKVEKNARLVAPRVTGLIKPNWMIDPSNRMSDPAALKNLFEAANPTATSGWVSEGVRFGNAVEFFIALLKEEVPLGNFDLDGDRGYAYKTWDVLPPSEKYI